MAQGSCMKLLRLVRCLYCLWRHLFQCIVWNVEAAEPINVFSSTHNDTIFSINWNREGSLFTTTCKDKRVRVLDPRLASVAIVRALPHPPPPPLFSSPLPLFVVSGNAISSRLKSFQKCFPSQRSSLHVWLLQVTRTTTTYLGSRKYSKYLQTPRKNVTLLC